MSPFTASRVLPAAITVLLGAGFIGHAIAAPQGGNDRSSNVLAEEYLEIDANEDGRITEVEVLSDRTEKFRALDADGDGAITLEEVRMVFSETVPDDASKALRKRGIDDLSILFIDSMDTNDDGRLDLAEFQRPARERFRQIDANSDGFATPGETTVFFSKIRF